MSNTTSKKNKIVCIGSELRLPLLEGKKSFDEKSDGFKRYVWTIKTMFESINKDMRNKSEDNNKKSNETLDLYIHYIDTKNFINNSDSNAELEEKHVKDKYFLNKNLDKFKNNTNINDNWLSYKAKKDRCYCFFTDDFFNNGRKAANGGSPNNHTTKYDCDKRMGEIRDLFESFNKNILENKSIKSFQLNNYHYDICLEIVLKCKEILSALRIAQKKSDSSSLNYLFEDINGEIETRKISHVEMDKLHKIVTRLTKCCIDFFTKEVIKIKWNIITDDFQKEFIASFNKKISENQDWINYLSYFIDSKNARYNNVLNNFIN